MKFKMDVEFLAVDVEAVAVSCCAVCVHRH